jgi:hypothetical protein
MLVQKRSSISKNKIIPYSEWDLGVHKTLNIINFSHRTLFPLGAATHRGQWPSFS